MIGTVIIDDVSDPGAWATEIAHTARFSADCINDPVDALRVDPPSEAHNVND